jgi:hypothetical protein
MAFLSSSFGLMKATNIFKIDKNTTTKGVPICQVNSLDFE